MVHTVKMTKEEKMTMYMKLSKKELCEMLINCNDIIENLSQVSVKTDLVDNSFLYKCDVCGKHPSIIMHTTKGTFCQEHAKY